MYKFLFVCVCASLVFVPKSDCALTPEQREKIQAHFHQLGMECFQELPITEADVADLKAKKIATGPNVPCFLACMMKKMGILNANGSLQKDTAIELAKQAFSEPEEIANIGAFLDSCAPVNDAAVTDGEKGCDRAMLAFKCMLDNRAQFGFDV